MTSRTSAITLAAILSLGALGACRKKAAPVTVPSPAQSNVDDVARRRADSLAAAELAQRRADSLAEANRATEAGAQHAQAELMNVLQQRVYFDYDRDNLRDDATTALDAKAAILLANPSVSLAITGNTDERGTSEYNLALGQRRAAQVKRYLLSRGVTDARLTTQSLGDSEPAVQGTDEAAYQQNRRAEFTVSNAGATLLRPQP